jgi:2-polyprenyl-6-methoxyphenol hydroxylase-like FAD-dependent oxidoreductase
MEQSDVLIVGAGPTGLVLALWLTKAGTKVRIIDKTASPGTTSRALAVQARTLELYRQLDLTDAVVARGHRVPAANFWVGGERRARFSLDGIGKGATPYPFLHIFPQDEHEKLLVERLDALGIHVERQTELLGFTETTGGITARLRAPDGREHDHHARYLAGCDGARSKVRETIGTGFPGGTYQQLFYVADVDAEGPALNGELNLDLDTDDFVAIFPLAGEGRARLIGTVRDERADRAETLTFDDVSSAAIRQMKVSIRKVNWFSTYHVHHRVAQHFRKGRAFLVGDAAHIHSPAGGQGMNTGIGDAINLAWKLAAVVSGRAPESLLDSYEAERVGFARRLVASTDRAFTFASGQGRLAAFVRMHIAPIVIPAAFTFEAVRKFAFRTVSQTAINYRGSRLSRGSAGNVQGGDRLPWVQADGSDNFAPLTAIGWQVHVYGTAKPALTAWCEQQRVPLHVFPWRAEHEAAGLARDALHLLRPDTYVALAEPSGAAEALNHYFRDQDIRPVS